MKVFDPATGFLTIHKATAGIAPLHCPLVCTFHDRLVCAGPDHIWYMSRAGDPDDFDYGADPSDPARAVAGTNADAGLVGEPIRALIPHTDDYLILGCENSMWVMRGDPGAGGQLDSLSREAGIVGADAWCRQPDGTLIFLGREGLYALQAGGANYPQPFSRDVLPYELIDVDAVANVVTMAYDTRSRGLHLFITPTDGSAGVHWYIDAASKTFWSVTIPAGFQPYSLTPFAPDNSDARDVLLGGRDGFIRRFDPLAADDDGTPFASSVYYGPLSGGGPGRDGMMSELQADLDSASYAVTWNVRSGDTAQESVETTTVKATGSWAAGANRPQFVRLRGVAFTIELTSTVPWAIEAANATIRAGGRQR